MASKKKKPPPPRRHEKSGVKQSTLRRSPGGGVTLFTDVGGLQRLPTRQAPLWEYDPSKNWVGQWISGSSSTGQDKKIRERLKELRKFKE